MKTYSNIQLIARIIFEGLGWIMLFWFIVGVILLTAGIIENPEDLKTFLN